MKRYAAALAAVLTLPFAGCSGGGGAALPAAPSTSHGSTPVQFAVKIPLGSSTQSAARKPQYISPNTQSISLTMATYASATNAFTPLAGYPIIIATSAGSPNCTTSGGYRTCTTTLTGIPTDGTTTAMRMVAYSGPNATGSVLGDSDIDQQQYIFQQPVSSNGGNYTFSVTLGGVVNHFVFSQPQMLVEGTAASVPWIIQSYDSSGALIVPPGDWTDGNNYGIGIQNLGGAGNYITFGPSGAPSCAVTGNGTYGPDCATASIVYDGSAFQLPGSSGSNALFQYRIANTATAPMTWTQVNQMPIVSYASLSQAPLNFASTSSPAQTVTLALPSGAQFAAPKQSNFDLNITGDTCNTSGCIWGSTYTISPNSSFCTGSCSDVITFARANGSPATGDFGSFDAIQVPVLIGPGPYPAYTAFQAQNLTIPSVGAGSTPFVVTDLSQPQTSGLTWTMNTQFCTVPSHTVTWPPASSNDTGNIVTGSNPVFSAPATATMTSGSASFAITPLSRGTCQVQVSESTTGFSSLYYVTVGP